MTRMLSSVLILGLAAALASDAFAGNHRVSNHRVGNFRHGPVIQHRPHVSRYSPPTYFAPVRYCYRVEYSCATWHCRHFTCDSDARRFADYICGLGFEHRLVCQGGCFAVHFYLPHCRNRSFDHRCDADSFVSLLCGYGVHAHVIVVRH